MGLINVNRGCLLSKSKSFHWIFIRLGGNVCGYSIKFPPSSVTSQIPPGALLLWSFNYSELALSPIKSFYLIFTKLADTVYGQA